MLNEMEQRDEESPSQANKSEPLPKLSQRNLFHSRRCISRVPEGPQDDGDLESATLGLLIRSTDVDNGTAPITTASPTVEPGQIHSNSAPQQRSLVKDNKDRVLTTLLVSYLTASFVWISKPMSHKHLTLD